jgi:hypothetical protein
MNLKSDLNKKDNLSIHEALASVVSISREILDAEPTESNCLLVEALDDAGILNTRNSTKILEGFIQSRKYLIEIKDKSLSERILLLHEKKMAQFFFLLSKIVGGTIPILGMGTLLYGEYQPLIATWIANGESLPTHQVVGNGPNLFQGYTYFFCTLGWYLGGCISRFLPSVGKHIGTWKILDLISALLIISGASFLGYWMPIIQEHLSPPKIALKFLGGAGLAAYGAWEYMLAILTPLIFVTFSVALILALKRR